MSFLNSAGLFDAIPDTAIPDQQNLALHIDASQESLNDNDTTTTITDFSGNNNGFSGDSVIFKTNVINGQPAFEFDEDTLTNSQSLSDPFVIALVFEQTADNSESRLFGSNSLSSDLRVNYDTGEFRTSVENKFLNSTIEHSYSAPTNVFQTFVFEVDASNSTIRLDGSQVQSGTLSSGSITGLELGTVAGRTGRGLIGNVSELAIYDTTTNITDLENYLSDKYATF
ncbi:hypothetical protein OSG_eHP8_00105 [environmental Halophage eHP-8]|nr:hypothetical protein OSG_eHP8_00105 [environmental Halophage eHP-8]AFH21946.1 hypothetical protein OSG_eHP13_00110 [environmental Halophage eHP-13]